jgi:DNA (cytosine-5)-methyltransferase 1
MLRCFHDAGYDVEWRVINAGEYGFAQRRRRIFIFGYHKSTNYYKATSKLNSEKIIFNNGIFAKQFKIEEISEKNNSIDISSKMFKGLEELSNSFKDGFYNSGHMHNGKIVTHKITPITKKGIPLKDIITKEKVNNNFFLTEDAINKFIFLKGPKRIPRLKTNGETYYYTEGGMAFPDNLDCPARTMLTSESSINRSSHIVEDYMTKKMRFITPEEAERINGFPTGWTNTGMTQKRRYFMMGNALVVGIVRQLGNKINDIINKE